MDSYFPPTSGCAPVAHDESGVGGLCRIPIEKRIKNQDGAKDKESVLLGDKQERHARRYALSDANASVPSAFPSRTAPNVYSCNILINYTQG